MDLGVSLEDKAIAEGAPRIKFLGHAVTADFSSDLGELVIFFRGSTRLARDSVINGVRWGPYKWPYKQATRVK